MEKARTFATLCFTTPEAAKAAHDQLHNQCPEPFKKHMMLFYAQSPPEPERESPKVIELMDLLTLGSKFQVYTYSRISSLLKMKRICSSTLKHTKENGNRMKLPYLLLTTQLK